MAKKINITAQLNAATTDGILADAGQIFDAKKGKFQEQVNQEFEDALEEAITSEDTGVVVESIEEGIIHNALRKNKQILTEAEKYQARHNISAITAEEAEKIAQDKINENAVSSPDKLQAVKELSSWLEENPDSAATMNAAIQENAADIQRLYRGTGIDEYSRFSTGMDYSAGAVVLYDGVLFRFKADHAKGAWDYNEVEEWSEKKEREERVSELESEVGNVRVEMTQFNSFQKRAYIYGDFKTGENIKISVTGSASVKANTMIVRYDDIYTNLGTLVDVGTEAIFTLTKDTSFLVVLLNDDNIVTSGTIFINAIIGHEKRLRDIEAFVAENKDIQTDLAMVKGELSLAYTTNASNKLYSIIPNCTYKLRLSKTSWGATLTDTDIMLGVFVKYANVEESNLIAVKKSEGIKPSYNFTIDNIAVDYIRIAVNGTLGDIVRYELTNETDSLANKVEIANLTSHIFAKEELLPSNSLLDANTELIVRDNKGIGAGAWEIRYTDTDSIVKNEDDSFSITLTAPSGNNSALWLLNSPLILANVGKSVNLKLSLKTSSTLRLVLGGGEPILFTNTDWVDYNIDAQIQTGYPDGRIMFFSNAPTNFSIKNISISLGGSQIEKLSKRVDVLDERIKSVESGAGKIEDINLTLRNYRYKTASIELNKKGQYVIALIGDSWTQHSWASLPTHGEEGDYVAHTNYVLPLVKYLKDKYGDAGGGYYSFSISHPESAKTKMMSADYEDAWDERSTNASGLITYRDEAEGCVGLDAADATFNAGAYIILHATNPQSRFVIHFYGSEDAGVFSYKLDSQNEVSVNASQYSGYSTIVIETTDNTHDLRIECISGSVKIMGVDMQRESAGVRIHKIANKGSRTDGFARVNADAWKIGISALGLDSALILMGTNDGSATTSVYNNLKSIFGWITSVNFYVDKIIVMPSNNRIRDMSEQAKSQYKLANEIGAAFVNLIPLFGSVEQIIAKETFADLVHPTLAGGKMIANYLIGKLFESVA